ncbi:hypothetical protein GIB67_007072 [Kingdonia uniflora]|uniref:Uncharacterized protein n=1 Tax=Kingdonia uniflora TaxID=39325 RepID=A0A7J7NZD8_9MAGN|nr:hypothetical protein GIB67_007072 [Kingdonia uniflora]
MMNLFKLLASDTNVLVTFIVTEEWLGFISSVQKPSNLHFWPVLNVIPSELGCTTNLIGFMEAVFTKMEAPVEELMDQLEGPPTMSSSVFTKFYDLDLLTENQHFPVDLADLPTIYSGQKVLNRVLEAFYWARKSQVSSEQLEEIVAEVRSSRVQYLWVPRGFWTHCGWNSTMEGAFAGVPMLTLPILFNQVPNAKQIVDDWKIGVRVKESRSEVMVKREDIAMTVQRFMNLDGDGSQEMRRRASEIIETCQLALANGGSSASTLSAFVREILQSHC